MCPTDHRSEPEAKARAVIDSSLERAGWIVQDYDDMDLSAGPGIAVREFKMQSGHGKADYLLFVDKKAAGALEAKPAGFTLSGAEIQTKKYTDGLPKLLYAPHKPLPFAYLSTGTETGFINFLDPKPRSRPVFGIHRPETLREWLSWETLEQWLQSSQGFFTSADNTKPSTLRARLRAMPPLHQKNLWPNQIKGIINLEKSLFEDKPRTLIQMATGSGKTLLTVNALYRLIKFGGARRVLFLVDRQNLGEQAEKEFLSFRTPDDGRKFNELYNVQRLSSNSISNSAKVVICTIQRLYSILKGEPALDPELDEASGFLAADRNLLKEPLPVVYNERIPPEFFDVIFIDECHRSIYSLWRQVLLYFDAYLLGLTATPASHTYGFFNQNVVMEYPHAQAVADGVNCDFDVFRIRTRISAQGSVIEAEPGTMVGYRDRQTRRLRWEAPDEDMSYSAGDLDKHVVALDQIRLIAKTFRDVVLKMAYPLRSEVPKTLIFAKDDSHAEDIVKIMREEFGGQNEFCQKITYKVTQAKPADLIQDFRNRFFPRVAVTVDLIATGTDIKPVEIVMFMRSVKSRVLFEQMKGRGVRVLKPDELKVVSPDAVQKTHFLIVDCVGVTEAKLSDTRPLEKLPHVALKTILEHVASGGLNDGYLSSLASRLSRIEKQCGPSEKARLEEVSGGLGLSDIVAGLVDALDDETRDSAAREMFGLSESEEPTEAQLVRASEPLKEKAVLALMSKPGLRKLILELKHQFEQMIDDISRDELLHEETGFSEDAKAKAAVLVKSFEEYLKEHREEIEALQFYYGVPYRQRPRFKDIKALAETIARPPHSWTPERLWRAYETLEKSKVRGASAERLLTDVVSLVRYALKRDDALVPHAERVRERFKEWIRDQGKAGREFSADQMKWLEMMRDHIGTSLEMEMDDFELMPFVNEGGLSRASKVFGGSEIFGLIVQELNEALAA